MPFKDRGRARRLVLAGAVALTLAGTGAALAWPADGPSPSPSSTAPAPSPSHDPSGRAGSPPGHQDSQYRQDKGGKQHRAHKQHGPDKQDQADHARGGRLQHSESVVKDADGSFRTVLVQRGTVEAVSGTSVTVRSEDGYSQAYAVDADTRISGHPAAFGHRSPAADDDDKPAGPRTGTVPDIAVGDWVRVFGVKEGDRVTATRIAPGAGNVRGGGR
ncbi:DUF5666 domain-containing protein [Pseudarthrobacter sp. NPDC092424]|uniref:DUF5666 domain-containing protein n=1 Tax=Pseudarthrobacter sp. NPDC092424 TaxID=3364415 RepID=UPI00381A1B12